MRLRDYLEFINTFWSREARLPEVHEVPLSLRSIRMQDNLTGRELELRVRDYLIELGCEVSYSVEDDINGVDLLVNNTPWQISISRHKDITNVNITYCILDNYTRGELTSGERYKIRVLAGLDKQVIAKSYTTTKTKNTIHYSRKPSKVIRYTLSPEELASYF